MGTHLPVVVGVDGSRRAMGAAVWAGAWAARTGAQLELISVLPSPGYHYSEAAPLFQDRLAWRAEESAHEILARAERRVTSTFPDIDVLTGTHPGPPGLALAQASTHAAMVVVGSTGDGALESLLTGSTVIQVINRSHCPVTVFRSGSSGSVPDHRPVVVGADGSELSALAIATAAAFATAFEAPLVVVHGWGVGGLVRRPAAASSWAVVEDEHAVLMEECLVEVRAGHPDLKPTTVVERADPVELILGYARDAQLVVVGSHGHNRLSGAILGSTSHALVRRVDCPITICRRAGRSYPARK